MNCLSCFLFDNSTVAAHCVWIDAEDIKILSEKSVGVAHNPISNMILASGICPVPELRSLGINVGIGIDGAGSNDSQDMLQSIKITPLLQRVKKMQRSEERRVGKECRSRWSPYH